jgi:hypothetical protein
MSFEAFEIPMPVVRQVEMPQPAIEAPQLVNVQTTQPTQEQARAAAAAFAHRQQGLDVLGHMAGLASAGMVLHDLVSDTLAAPEEDEEEAEQDAKRCPSE